VLGEADPGAELDRARASIRRPMTRWLELAEPERKRKMHQHLAARGFGYDVIEEVIASPEGPDDGMTE